MVHGPSCYTSRCDIPPPAAETTSRPVVLPRDHTHDNAPIGCIAAGIAQQCPDRLYCRGNSTATPRSVVLPRGPHNNIPTGCIAAGKAQQCPTGCIAAGKHSNAPTGCIAAGSGQLRQQDNQTTRRPQGPGAPPSPEETPSQELHERRQPCNYETTSATRDILAIPCRQYPLECPAHNNSCRTAISAANTWPL